MTINDEMIKSTMVPQPMTRRNRSRSCSSIYKSQPIQTQHPLEEIVESMRHFHLDSPKVLPQSAPVSDFSPTKELNICTTTPGEIEFNNLCTTNQEDAPVQGNIACSPIVSTCSSPKTPQVYSSPSQLPIQDLIGEIVNQYKDALDNVTKEVTNLRGELADLKQQIKTNFKVINNKQSEQKQQLQCQLNDNLQSQKQQQHQFRNQIKQQIEKQYETMQLIEPPKPEIQYEEITIPQTKPKPPMQHSKKKNNFFSPPNKQQEKNEHFKSKMTPADSNSSISHNSISEHKQQQNNHRNPRKIDAMLLGSSIVKHVKGRSIKKESGTYIKVCSFPGADTEKVADHAEVELKYAIPETAILHAGGNDMAYGVSAEMAVDNLAYLGCELLDRGVKHIAISGMVPRYGMKNKIRKINELIKGMCQTYNFDFINNNNIYYYDHMANDGIHLNYDGVWILENNYSRYLNDLKTGNKE